MSEYIFDPLGMTRSSFKTQPATGGVIPVDNITSGWNRDLGIGNAGGGLYMSTTDLVTAGQAMLQSQLLTPAQTRRWFRPRMQTGYIGSAVGAPWEITFLKQPHKRLIPYYIKDGDIDAYHSVLVLSPEQEVGFVVLTAGSADSNAAIIRSFIKIALGEIFAPAIEEQARIEAGLRFNGTYLDAPTNSSVTIAAGHDGSTGLSVTSLVSRGVQIIGPGMNHENPMVSQLGVTNITKLYPTTLKTVLRKSSGCGDYVSRLGFRAAFQPHLVGGTLQDPCLLNWANLDGITYGREGLDDWVFEISEDGIVTGVVSRALQLSFSSKA